MRSQVRVLLSPPKKDTPLLGGVFFYGNNGLEPIAVELPGGQFLPPVQTLVATIVFARKGKNANRVLMSLPYMKNPNYFTMGSVFGFFIYIKDLTY